MASIEIKDEVPAGVGLFRESVRGRNKVAASFLSWSIVMP